MKPSWLVQRLNPPFVSQIWSFDYMGAAEFEFGALPKTLQTMVEDTPWVRGNVKVEAEFCDWEEHGKRTVTGTIYYVCTKRMEDEVRERVAELARGDVSLKERAGVGESLAELESWETRGWMELDNGFLFFSDKSMFDKAVEMFEELFDDGEDG